MIWSDSIERVLRQRLAGLPGARVWRVDDLPGSAEAFLLWALARNAGRTVLWVGDGPHRLDLMLRDLRTLAPDTAHALLPLPGWESLPGPKTPCPDVTVSGMRLATLQALADLREPAVVATTFQALME
ncbi:MAG: hypothetical protein E4H17_03120, partial [Gemmatimonadales bacterium]